MPGPNEIGKAKITVEADVSGVSGPINQAKGEVDKLGDSAQTAGDKLDGSFSRAGEAIEESTKGLRKFVGALSSVVGVATAVVGILALFRGAIAKVQDRIKSATDPDSQEGSIVAFTRHMQELVDVATGAAEAVDRFPVLVKLQKDLEDTSRRIDEVRLDLGIINDAIVPTISGAINKGKLSEELEQLQADAIRIRKAIQSLESSSRKQSETEQIESNRRVADDLLSVLDNLNKEAQISLLPEEDQIGKRLTAAVRKAQEITDALGTPDADAIFDSYKDALIRAAKLQLDLLADAKDEETRLDAERIAKNHAQQMKNIQQQADAFASGINGAFGANSEFTTRLDAIVAEVRKANEKLGMGGIRR